MAETIVINTDATELTAHQHKRLAEHFAQQARTEREQLAKNEGEMVLATTLEAFIRGIELDLMQAQVHATLATVRSGYR